MPIFEYECKQCGRAFEQLIRSDRDERSVACPSCGSKKAEKQFSVFAARKSTAANPLPMGGCGRCGDPNGSCGLN